MSITNLLLGRPLASSEQEEVKIGVLAGVPAMGLDALTSSAYGPEAALTILIPLGAAGLNYIAPITGVILVLLAMLYFSYRQTLAAYPVNGGSYTVARENLGAGAGLLAGASLMIDYVLNVAVGISAGVAALVSAVPMLHPYTLWLCLGVLVVMTLLNLRGTGEAGLAFALPTYLFILTLLIVLGLGIFKAAVGHAKPIVAPPAIRPAIEGAGIWVLLRAFASGSTAMTGVEAVSNSVSAFRPPAVKNAQRTLTVVVIVLAILLCGVAFLTRAYHVMAMPQDQAGYQSVLSQLVGAIIGRGWLYYVTIASVLATLCLSANTSFVGFPRLCRLIAADDFLPRGFAVVGRRLVYSVGIVALATAAGVLLAVFRGITDRLIPLFAVGAFAAFTLSQLGMVIHWKKAMRSPQTASDQDADGAAGRFVHARLWVNGIGAFCTGAALLIILAAKFTEGAWITILAVAGLFILFITVNRHYRRIDRQVSTIHPLDLSNNRRPVVLVPIAHWDRLTGKALRFSMWLSTDVIAVHLHNLSGEEAEEESQRVRWEWARNVEQPAREHDVPVPALRIVPSPYRNFLRPILDEIETLKTEHPQRLIAVVIPEVMETHWWQHLLHTRKPARLRSALLKTGDHRVIVISVPWYVEE
jgi:amino acid transporter